MVSGRSEKMKDWVDSFMAVVLTVAASALILSVAYWIASRGYAAGHPVYWDSQAKRYVEIGR
jgi:hypothetical protein